MMLLDRFNEVLQCDAADTDHLPGTGCTYGEARAIAAWALATREAAVGLPERWEPLHAFIRTHLTASIPAVSKVFALSQGYDAKPSYHRMRGDFMVGDFDQLRGQLYNLVAGVTQMARVDTYYRPRDVVRSIYDLLNAPYWEHA